MALWENTSPSAPAWLRVRRAPRSNVKLPGPARLRSALEQGPELLREFGRFLAGRADLLPSAYLSEIQKIPPRQSLPAESVPPSLDLSSPAPLRSSFGCDVFSADYNR